MLTWIRRNSQTFATINAILTLTIAAAAAVGTILQVWIAASQKASFPQVEARSIRELRAQVEDRRTALRKEIQYLDTLLTDLTRAEAALTGAPLEVPVRRIDPWWMVAVKTIAVCFVLIFSLYAAIVAAIFDVILLIFDYHFPLLRAIWNWSWGEVTIRWYWGRASAIGVVMGLLILILPSAITQLTQAREERLSKRQEAAPY